MMNVNDEVGSKKLEGEESMRRKMSSKHPCHSFGKISLFKWKINSKSNSKSNECHNDNNKNDEHSTQPHTY